MNQTCTKCGKLKPIDQFHRMWDHNGNRTRRKQCRSCIRKRRYASEAKAKKLKESVPAENNRLLQRWRR